MSRPGRLDRRVEVWTYTVGAVGDLGQFEPTYTLAGSRWAELNPTARGAERFVEEAEREGHWVTITLRYDELTALLSAADRLRYNAGPTSDEYDIQTVSDRFGEHRYIDVRAIKRGPEASRLPA